MRLQAKNSLERTFKMGESGRFALFAEEWMDCRVVFEKLQSVATDMDKTKVLNNAFGLGFQR